jgi:hypothetical protein
MKMTAFETWQVIVSIITAAILLATFLAALYIGLKQTEIGRKQTEISIKQTEISEKQAAISQSLLDIPFLISVEVVYDPVLKRFNILNKGQTNVFLWGTKLGDGPVSMENEPRLISVGGFYYLLAPAVESDVLKAHPHNGEMRGKLDLYLTSQNDTKYLVSTIIFAKVSGGKCAIHTQTTSIKPREWERQPAAATP